MKTINGAQGEGGGQIFRTCLTLSMTQQIPVKIQNIRLKRPNPGLRPQHLMCLRAAATICNARIKGDFIGSTEVEFIPDTVEAGDYHFSIGTAGSTCLLFQTLLPALAHASQKSTVRLEGGTHNVWCPSFEFLTKSYLHTINRLGYCVTSSIQRYGFVPDGGGDWTATIHPHKPDKCALDLIHRGEIITQKALVISANIPEDIPNTQINYLKNKSTRPFTTLDNISVESPGVGNLISLMTVLKTAINVCDAWEEKGIKSERACR